MLGGNIACDKLVILETTVRHPYYGESIIDKVGEHRYPDALAPKEKIAEIGSEYHPGQESVKL